MAYSLYVWYVYVTTSDHLWINGFISGSVTSIPENSRASEGERSGRGSTVCKGRVKQSAGNLNIYHVLYYVVLYPLHLLS